LRQQQETAIRGQIAAIESGNQLALQSGASPADFTGFWVALVVGGRKNGT